MSFGQRPDAPIVRSATSAWHALAPSDAVAARRLAASSLAQDEPRVALEALEGSDDEALREEARALEREQREAIWR